MFVQKKFLLVFTCNVLVKGVSLQLSIILIIGSKIGRAIITFQNNIGCRKLNWLTVCSNLLENLRKGGKT